MRVSCLVKGFAARRRSQSRSVIRLGPCAVVVALLGGGSAAMVHAAPATRARAGGARAGGDDSGDRAGAARSPFGRGVQAFRAGAYVDAERFLRGVLAQSRGGKTADWAAYLHAESAFYSGAFATATAGFDKLSKMKGSRFVDVAAFRAADSLWTSGAHAAAAERYRRLLPRLPARAPSGIDQAVARFRVAFEAEERKQPEAARLFLAIYRDFPAHPLAAQARRHLPQEPSPDVAATGVGGAAGAQSATPTSAAGPITANSIADQLRRAETLTRERHWPEALEELAKLPAELPPELATERDFQIGMTKFQMRRDYGKAAELLLKVAPRLSGDKAASALFHGNRALSRVDRDDEAIAGYKQVVARFPQSRHAAEAQFLSGWLDYNRGRYKESLPGLTMTVERFGKSAFADDAAWCIAFAHFMLGAFPEASAALDRYARMPVTGMTGDERASRVAYWKARVEEKAKRLEPAKVAYRETNRRWPFSFYGVLARARLAAAGEVAPAELPRRITGTTGTAMVPGADAIPAKKLALDPTLARTAALAAVGLDVEAGWELQREEKNLLQRWGDARGMRILLTRYPELKAFRRAYELGEGRHGGALSYAPEPEAPQKSQPRSQVNSGGHPAVRLWWLSAYPRAYREWVERYGPPSGNPDLLLYAIMRKESGFSPWDVSTADARGLLQMLPATSARVAATEKLDFTPDQLFDPETNIRLGALYIGALSKKFGGQIPLVAGAFNAGPKAMAKWCDQHGTHPIDEFVELIAFTQTREYAKRVVAIFARYRHLYGPADYQLPLTVNPKYAPAGPDY